MLAPYPDIYFFFGVVAFFAFGFAPDFFLGADFLVAAFFGVVFFGVVFLGVLFLAALGLEAFFLGVVFLASALGLGAALGLAATFFFGLAFLAAAETLYDPFTWFNVPAATPFLIAARRWCCSFQ